MDKCGIYVIEQISTGLSYIGSSHRVSARWYAHKRLLKSGRHHSPRLQAAWSKYGESDFSMRVLEECPRTSLLVKEQEYIDAFRPVFNACPLARSRAGSTVLPEVRERIRRGMTGKKFTAEHRANISAARKASLAATAQWRSALVAAKTTEAVEKIRATLTGRKRPPEVAAKVGLANRGRKWTEEQKARLAAKRPQMIATRRANRRAKMEEE